MSDLKVYEIISLDGPSGAGKSTVAKLAAKKLGYKYLDTGAMYRAVTLFFLNKNVNIQNDNEIISAISDLKISFDNNNKIYLNDVDVSEEIRSIKR